MRLIFVFLLALSACTSTGKRYTDDMTAAQQHCQKLLHAPLVMTVKEKLYAPGGLWGPIRLTDTTRVSSSEKNAVAAYFNATTTCARSMLSIMQQYNVPSAEYRNHFNRSTKINASLYAGEITYGEYAQLKSKSSRQLHSEQQEAANNERQRRSEANRAAADWLLAQDPPRRNSTSNTNCTTIGVNTSCTTTNNN